MILYGLKCGYCGASETSPANMTIHMWTAHRVQLIVTPAQGGTQGFSSGAKP